jgi:transcriptional regulator with XRE-family HTH domain
MKKTETYSSVVLDELFDEITPQELKRTENRMLMAAKIADALEAKWGKGAKGRLAKKMGYNSPSIVSKWLSGTNNFTIDLLSDIEGVLGIRLLDVEEKQVEPQVYVYCATVEASSGHSVQIMDEQLAALQVGQSFTFNAQNWIGQNAEA